MGRGILELVVLGAVCSLAVFIAVVGQTSAATEKTDGSAPVSITAKPAKQPLVQGQTSSTHQAKKSSLPTANQPEPGQKQVKPVVVEPKLRSPKGLLPASAQREAEAVHKQSQAIAPEPKPVSPKIPQPTTTTRPSEAIQKQTKPISAESKGTSPKSPMSVATERQPEVREKPVKSESVEPKPVNPKSPLPIVSGPQQEAIKKQAEPVQAGLKPTSRKNPRLLKVRTVEVPKAVVQPSTELMYHGILESPQRYDPRRIHHIGAGAPDPHNPELTHDHFQELDRNQDGSIDPVERVFGRLDMDRDLHDRRPR